MSINRRNNIVTIVILKTFGWSFIDHSFTHVCVCVCKQINTC